MLAAVLCFLLSLTLPVQAQAQVEVVDYAGRTVRLEQPAQRIIALAPDIVENAFSAGAGGKLVGVAEYSDYPAAAKDIHRVGNYNAWALEEIIALKPDLVLMWASGNGMHRLPALERLGLTVYVNEARDLADIATSIRHIGILAGTDAVSEAEAERLEAETDRLRATYASAKTLSVFYQIWHQPLQTINGEHMISHLIELCGGRNIYEDEDILAPRINVESVLARDPDIIMGNGMDEARPEWLHAWKRYPSLSAVKNGALIFVHPDLLHRSTARALQGTAIMCEKMQVFRERREPGA